MQAIIERESERDAAPAIPRRQVVVDSVTSEAPRPYKAPLATFLALMASARASAQACAADDEDN